MDTLKLGDSKPYVVCGKCRKQIIPIMLKTPQCISTFDKIHNRPRDHSFNCCGHSWLMGQLPDGGTECIAYDINESNIKE